MAIVLLLGLAALIAWPTTRFYRSYYLEHTIAVPAPRIDLNPEGGPWKRDYCIDIYTSYGWFNLDIGPNFISAFWDGPDDITPLWADGYHQEGYMAFFKPPAHDWLEWYEPIDYDNEWHFEYTANPSIYLSTPLWAIAIPCLLIPASWFYVTLKRIFTRRLRMQTNLCLHCGYNLTGVESDKCPECGAGRPLVTVSSAG